MKSVFLWPLRKTGENSVRREVREIKIKQNKKYIRNSHSFLSRFFSCCIAQMLVESFPYIKHIKFSCAKQRPEWFFLLFASFLGDKPFKCNFCDRAFARSGEKFWLRHLW